MIRKQLTLEEAKTFRPYVLGKGVYVSVLPSPKSVSELARWTKALGFSTEDKLEEFHCTVVLSKQPSDYAEPVNAEQVHSSTLSRVEYWKGHDGDGYVVAILDSPDLLALHKKWLDRGAVHSFSDYIPHVTLQDKLDLTLELEAKIQVFNSLMAGRPLFFKSEAVEAIKD